MAGGVGRQNEGVGFLARPEPAHGAAAGGVVVLSARRLFREALARYLERETTFEVRCAADWASLDAGSPSAHGPALVLLDETVDASPASANGTPVALLCRQHESGCRDVRTRLGAAVCLPRQADGVSLVSTLGAFAVTGKLADEPRRRPQTQPREPASNDIDRLTPRQRVVLELLVDGSRPDGIAAGLGISLETVRAHLQAVMSHLGTTSLAETVTRAQELEPRRAGHDDAPRRPTPRRSGEAIRVVAVNPYPLDLTAWQAALESAPGIEVVGVAGALRAANDAVERAQPAVVVVHADVTGPSAKGCATLKATLDPPRVLVVSETRDPGVLRFAVEAGADGYLAGDAPVEELASAVHRVHANEPYVPPGMLGDLLQHLVRQGRQEDAVLSRYVRLTRTERRVLALLSQGMNNEAIAGTLVVSPHTTRTHIQNLLNKLGVHSRVELVALDLRYGLTARFGQPESERTP